MSDFNLAIPFILSHEGGYVWDRSDPADLLVALQLAVAAESAKYYVPSTSLNRRKYNCEIAGCPNKAYAKGLCNAHYLRRKKGLRMDAPLVCRKRRLLCSDCGKSTNSKGAWGHCSRCIKSHRKKVLKAALLMRMGSACKGCGHSYPCCVMDFHHLGNKTDSMSELLADASLKRIATEAAKCVPLCANCHRMETYNG